LRSQLGAGFVRRGAGGDLPMNTVIRGAGEFTVEIDPTSQEFLLELVGEYEEPKLYPSPRAARVGEQGWRELPESRRSFVGAAELAHKAKQFDDGLVAAVELAAQDGAGRLGGKAALIRTLCATLGRGAGPDDLAAARFHAAARLGGLDVAIPEAVRVAADRLADEFLADELRSKPIAFYRWSEALARIFRQDRFLQSPIKGEAVARRVALALHGAREARATYEHYLRLVEWFVNPFACADLRPLLQELDGGATWPPGADAASSRPDVGPVRAFLPASRAHETELIEKLYGDTPIPDGFSLIDELIAGIRDGRLDLTPRGGWYDWTTWSFAPVADAARHAGSRAVELRDRVPDAPRGPVPRTPGDGPRDAHQAARETHRSPSPARSAAAAAGPNRSEPWCRAALLALPAAGGRLSGRARGARRCVRGRRSSRDPPCRAGRRRAAVAA